MQFLALKELFEWADLDLALAACTDGARITQMVAYERNELRDISDVRYPKNTTVYLLVKFVNKWDVLFYGNEPVYEVVYIGTTNKFYQRMEAHRRSKNYEYSVLLHLDKPVALQAEKVLITQIEPPLNVLHNANSEEQ
jgi:hypothetical protein